MNLEPSSSNEFVSNCLLSLAREIKELGIGTFVPSVDVGDISPLSFYREYVSPNLPVLIRNGCKHWPALEKWNDDYLCSVLKDKYATVAVTPNGYADSIAWDERSKRNVFAMPEERKMKMPHFIKALSHPEQFLGIFYIQQQNSNLNVSLTELLKDVDEEITWATEAFGQSPDAVNFWMGDHRAVTSLHKDPYENIYCVAKGYKDFILFPPTDLPWIPYERFPTATYRENLCGDFDLVLSKTMDIKTELSSNSLSSDSYHKNEVPWICIDPLSPDINKYPLYKNASPIHVRVQAGDTLFLPALWFHHVRQSHKCIAINYWYDMQFDIKYAYNRFLENVCNFKSVK